MIRVALICHFSNAEIRERIKQRVPWWEALLRKLLGKPLPPFSDFAIWNTSAIHEFEKHESDIELHVIAPIGYVEKKTIKFKIRGINYHFFRDEQDFLVHKMIKMLGKRINESFRYNRKMIANTLLTIQPHIVHVIGAENPYYSIASLDVPKSMFLIVQLQTLMSDPLFFENYKISRDSYDYRSDIEKKVICRADYIATTVKNFTDIIKKDIKKDATFLEITLPLTEIISESEADKEYDFVYFALDISKACDLALEAFAIAHKRHPDVTLDIVGGYSEDYYEKLQVFIRQNNLENSVRFEGKLPTHDDVISQIKKAKYALLPLKIDMVSGTIREAMANGLPVISTITQGTPALNDGGQTVLLSEIGNHQEMANNMCLLLKDDKLADMLRTNGYKMAKMRKSNKEVIDDWCQAYITILNKQL